MIHFSAVRKKFPKVLTLVSTVVGWSAIKMRISLTLNELILYFDFNLLETVYKNFDMKRWKKNFHPSKFYFVIGWSHPSTSNYLWPWNQLRAPCSKGQYVKSLLCFHIEAQIPYKLIKFYFCFVIFLEYKWWKFTFCFSSMHIHCSYSY